MISVGKAISVLSVIVFFVCIGTPRAEAADPGTCNRIMADNAVPAGFGSAWSVWGDTSKPLISGQCDSSGVEIEAGNKELLTLVHKTGYAWDGVRWNQFTFNGRVIAQGPSWLANTGKSSRINFGASGVLYAVGYVCEATRQDSQWKCGCRSQNQCSGAGGTFWNLQKFDRSAIIPGGDDDDDDVVGDDDDDSGASGPACGEGELLWSSTPSAANIGATGIWFFNSSQWNVLHHSNAGNISIAAAPDNSPAIRVRMIEGSHHGGAVETRPLTSNVPQTACLEYKMYLESDYELDTQGGGKFPGLFGGSYAPRGCVAGSGDTILGRGQAWSMRAGWTGSEQYKLYAYYHNKLPSCGVNMLTIPGRMPGGRWVTYSQEVHVNDVGQQNGYVKLWRDGELIGQQSNITFRLINGALPDGIYFDIYAGGSTGVFPKDQNVYFKDFKIYGPAAQ